MLPLDKEAAMEQVVERARSRWRVTIERPSGITWANDRHEERRPDALTAALSLFYAQHPEGTTEPLRIYCRPVHEREELG